MTDICEMTWIDQFPNGILNITTLLILVGVSHYFVSKISPTCNFKINESPKPNLFWLSSPNHSVGFWVTLSWVLFPKILSLCFTLKCWHVIGNLEIYTCFHCFWQKSRKTSWSLLKHWIGYTFLSPLTSKLESNPQVQKKPLKHINY